MSGAVIQNGHICSQLSSTSTLASRCYARSGYARILPTNPSFSNSPIFLRRVGLWERTGAALICDETNHCQSRARTNGVFSSHDSPGEVTSHFHSPRRTGGRGQLISPPYARWLRQTTKQVTLRANTAGR